MMEETLSLETPFPFLAWGGDHTRHGQTLQRLSERLSDLGMTHEVLQELRVFQCQLRQHYTAEEYVVFPVLNGYRPMVLMTVEHDQLLRHLDRVIELGQEELNNSSSGFKLWEPIWVSFTELLLGHIHEEDEQLTPWMAKTLRLDQLQSLQSHWEKFMAQYDPDRFPLLRPTPYMVKASMPVSQSLGQRPLQFLPWAALGDGTEIQRLVLAKGSATATHWSPQHQWIYVLSGTLWAQSPLMADPPDNMVVSVGEALHITPRCDVKLSAPDSDVECILVKAWPAPPPYAPMSQS